SLRGAKRRSNPSLALLRDGLLRFARNDESRHPIHMSNSDGDARQHPRGTTCPSFARLSPLSSSRGRRESRVPIAPVGPVQTKSTGVGPQVNRSNAGFPCAMVYGLLRALPGDRAFLPPSPARCASIAADLTPASGRQDHTTSPSAMPALVARRHPRPPHPTATFVTCATPLLSGGTRGLSPLICPATEAEFFCAKGWTTGWTGFC